jgi:hypothetical protein
MSIVNIPKDFNFASDVFNLSIETAEKIGCEKGLKQGNKYREFQKDNESKTLLTLTSSSSKSEGSF